MRRRRLYLHMRSLLHLSLIHIFYVNWMGKCFMLFVLGEKPLDAGMNILLSLIHI